jgi:hypothetical protein
MSQEEPNRNLTGRNPEEELPPELKAMEAELSALRPRDDRLDRERLVFRAGQASVGGGRGRRVERGAGWAWPASFATMTAVAATLLVMLLLRPQPQVVERIHVVEVPVEPAESHSVGPTGDTRRDTGPSPSEHPSLSDPFPAARPLASHAFGSRAEYLESFQRMLAWGVDPWRQPLGVSSQGGELPGAPLPYHDWLKTILDDEARAEQRGDWPNSDYSGGES